MRFNSLLSTHSIPEGVFGILKPIIHQLGSQIGMMAIRPPLSEWMNAPTPMQQIKTNPQFVEAQVDYLRRHLTRRQELIKVTALQNAEKTRELQQEDVQDKQKLSLFGRQLLYRQQAEGVKDKLQKLPIIWQQEPWFANLSRPETEQILQQPHPRLVVLVSPTRISEDCPASFRHNFNIELPAKLKSFLHQHYPPHHQFCAVQFYGDYFKHPISDLDIEHLKTILEPIPTAILYSQISDYEVSFNVGFWGIWHQYPMIVPMEPWNWEQIYHQLLTINQDEKHSLRLIRQFLVTLHKLVAAFLADLYYLSIDMNYEPQLVNLRSEFTQEYFAPDWMQPYIESLEEIRRQQRESSEQELRHLMLQEVAIESERKRVVTEKQQQQVILTDYQQRLAGVTKNPQWHCVHTLSGHTSFVNAIAISSQSQLFASGSWDKTIKLWNWAQGELRTTLAGHSDRVNAVVISPDAQILVSGSFDETIKVWQLPSGRILQTLTDHNLGVNSIAISPDGQLLASCGGDDHSIKLWELKTGKLLRTLTGHTDDVNAVVFSPDGRFLASGSSDATSKIWDVNTGTLLRSLSGLNLGVNSIAISPDGQTLASVRNDYTIKLRNLHTGRLLRILSNQPQPGKGVSDPGGGEAWHILSNYMSRGNSVAISPDGRTIASGSDDNTIKIWNLITGELLSTLEGHTGTVYAVAISADGQTLISGSGDETIKIWRPIG